MFQDDLETIVLLVGRYHQELKRTDSGWKLSRLVFEIMWGERRQDVTGFLAGIGGAGPHPLPK